uniref:Uncharacterized protein n=1 Tax=Timema tahoe TaxID=61484 RepID=A0A7R9P0C6_9NEOP|nr:unnamed protein product [Timema tahoe]
MLARASYHEPGPALPCLASHRQLTQSLRTERTNGRTTALSSKTITLLHLTRWVLGCPTPPHGGRSFSPPPGTFKVAMKAEMLLGVLLVVGLGSRPGDAWGGLFNRFSPEMLSNLGYGGHGYGSYRSQPLLQGPKASSYGPAVKQSTNIVERSRVRTLRGGALRTAHNARLALSMHGMLALRIAQRTCDASRVIVGKPVVLKGASVQTERGDGCVVALLRT